MRSHDLKFQLNLLNYTFLKYVKLKEIQIHRYGQKYRGKERYRDGEQVRQIARKLKRLGQKGERKKQMGIGKVVEGVERSIHACATLYAQMKL